MGRARLEIKRIENSTNRQVTFSKRRNGLLKKAYEIAILCDIQIALLMSSPSGRLSYFSSQKRIEDVFARFANLSDREREDALAPQCLKEEHSFGLLQDKGHVIRSLDQLRRVATTTEIEEAWQEIRILLQQLQIAEGNLRMFEPDLRRMTSIEEIESHEKHLEDLLNRVVERKNCLMSHLGSSEKYSTALQEACSSSSHERPVSFGVDAVNWLPDSGQSRQASDSAQPPISIRESFPIICLPSQEKSCKSNLEKGEDCGFRSSSHEIPSHSRDLAVMQGTDVSYFATQVPPRK